MSSTSDQAVRTTAPEASPVRPRGRGAGRRTSRGSRTSPVGRAALYVVLVLGAVLMVVPFVWMVLTSLKTLPEVNSFSWLPEGFVWRNYIDAFQAAPFLMYFRNSLIVVVFQTIPLLLVAGVAGYALAQLPVKGATTIFNYFVILLAVPFQVLIVPLFMVVRSVPLAGGNNILGQGGVGWIDTWWALIVPFVSGPLYVFLARQFFLSLPGELADAARVDGLSEFGIFRRVMAPLARPAFVTMALFNAESAWNGFVWPLVATSSENLRPLQFGLATFAQSTAGQPQWPFLMAVSALATLPMILLFVFGQRYFIAGLADAGLKG